MPTNGEFSVYSWGNSTEGTPYREAKSLVSNCKYMYCMKHVHKPIIKSRSEATNILTKYPAVVNSTVDERGNG